MPTYTLDVNTSGAAGSATGSKTQDSGIKPGFVAGIKLDYHASAPVSTVVKVSEADGLGQTILQVTGSTDKVFYPVVPTHKSADGTETGQTSLLMVEGRLKVDVTLSNELSPCVTASILILDNRDIR